MFSTAILSSRHLAIKAFAFSGLALALGVLAAPARAQQTQRQPGDVDSTVQSSPEAFPDAPPDDIVYGSPAPDDQDDSARQGSGQTLTIPAGTVIAVRTNQWISSDRNLPGDGFNAVLDQPVVVDGLVVARRGQLVLGRISEAQKSHHGGDSKLGVELKEITLVDGQQLNIDTQLMQNSTSGSSRGRDLATLGTATGVGAAIGGAAAGGEGAGVGAVIGATAGVLGVMATPGRPTLIAPESLLVFRLQNSVPISTERSQFAFQPVNGPQDQDAYAREDRSQQHGPRRGDGVAPPPGYGPPPPAYYGAYGYPYAGYPYYYGYYPGPVVFGYYGGYGYRGRFGGYRRGFRR
jgi:hypothetical protein